MKKCKDFNNISKELRDQFTLGKNQTKVFRVLGVRKVGDEIIIPSMVKIPSVDIIYDPHSEQFVDICMVKNAYPNPTTGKYDQYRIEFNKSNGGCFVLKGSNPYHRELYMFLALSNYNASNKNRNKTVTAFYEELNISAEVESKMEMEKNRMACMNFVFTASASQLKLLGNKLGLNSYKTIADLKRFLMQKVERNANSFYEVMISVERVGEVPILINQLLEAKIIKYDTSRHLWVHTDGGDKIHIGTRGIPKAEQILVFAEFLNSEKGKAVKQKLEKLTEIEEDK